MPISDLWVVRFQGWLGVFLLGLAMTARAEFLTPEDVDALPSKPADWRIAYGDESLQYGEFRLPEGKGPHPVVIVIHGGCWTASFADIRNTAALADALRDDGLATWNVEYRRMDNAGGGWPGTFHDIARAVDYLRVIAADYRLDLHRVIVIGHSAGGHLALWSAGRHRLPETARLSDKNPLPLTGVVALAGIGDLDAFARSGLGDCAQAATALMGGTRRRIPERYAQASPIEMLPLGVPQILITGSRDGIVPVRFGAEYLEAALHAGDNVQHLIVDNAAHHEYNAPSAVTWTAIRHSVRSLLGLER